MSLFTVLATSKVAAGVLAAGAVAVGGTGVAAFNGALPTEIQQTAHDVVGAPAPSLPELPVKQPTQRKLPRPRRQTPSRPPRQQRMTPQKPARQLRRMPRAKSAALPVTQSKTPRQPWKMPRRLKHSDCALPSSTAA